MALYLLIGAHPLGPATPLTPLAFITPIDFLLISVCMSAFAVTPTVHVTHRYSINKVNKHTAVEALRILNMHLETRKRQAVGSCENGCKHNAVLSLKQSWMKRCKRKNVCSAIYIK